MESESRSGKPPPLLVPEPPLVSGRLHASTLLFRILGWLRSLLIPIVIFLVLGRHRVMLPFIILVLAGPIIVSVIRYFTFTYRIQGGELILKHGLLGRTERHIPLNRVQDVRVEQGVLHRLFQVADVQIDTAGGEGPDAVLSPSWRWPRQTGCGPPSSTNWWKSEARCGRPKGPCRIDSCSGASRCASSCWLA
jgi:membrane protein YdbS with pleckstrin-like domain